MKIFQASLAEDTIIKDYQKETNLKYPVQVEKDGKNI